MDNFNIQRLLTVAKYYDGDIDGDIGPKSKKAIEKILNNRVKDLPRNWKTWGWKRKGIAAGQIILKYAGYDPGQIDGLFGPSTSYAFSLWEYENLHGKPPKNWREDVKQDLTPLTNKLSWPFQDQLTSFYGEAGGPQCTSGKVILPFKMKLAWDLRKKISVFSCHELVAESAQRAYDKIFKFYSKKSIEKLGFNIYGGCYNYRKMRGGNSLSTHAYGIAIDHNPMENQLKWDHTRASFARKECSDFWRIWEDEGWISLGRERDFDWMHVQAARLR